MLPSSGKGSTDKSCYPGESQYLFAYKGHGSELNTTEIKEYIKNPHKFNINSSMDNKYYNLWNVDNERIDANDDKVIKSVYDPCPVGYTVAPVRTFTGFTTTGSNSSTTSEWNVQGSFNNGWLFYGQSNKSGSTVFFPATGRRLASTGSLTDVSTYGWYWVAGLYSTSHGRDLYFRASNVDPLSGDPRSYGFAVRPAVEEEKDKLIKIKNLRKNGGHCLF